MLPARASFASSILLMALFLAPVVALQGCGGPTYPKCDKDEHCAERGEVCVEGTCQECRDDTNCGEGQQCVGGRCEAKPECTSDADCPGNQVCRSGQCQIECTGASDCGAGLKCLDNRCVDENACVSDADCPAGSSCEGGMCTTAISRSLEMCSYPTVRFAFDRAELNTSAREGLSEVASCIQEAGGTLVIEGHCDERGTEEYNLALGDRRARAVMEYLARLGVPRAKMQVISKGEAEPLVDRSTESAWAQNRRVEFEPTP